MTDAGYSLATIAHRKQAITEDKLDRVLEELAEAEEREREKKNQAPPRPARLPRYRAGSGNLHGLDRWNFCLTSA
jgi:hypothetical protein